MLPMISLLTTLPLYREGIIALGCKALLNSKKPLLIISKCLTILIPPEVLPAEPPKNISPKKKNGHKRSPGRIICSNKACSGHNSQNLKKGMP